MSSEKDRPQPKKATLWGLFAAFFRIGGLTFGGGYAMLPMLEREIVEKQRWATSEEILDYFAIGQCTPGIIAVNTATFIGYNTRGLLGGVFATLGVISPGALIMIVFVLLLNSVSSLPAVQHALAGITVAVCVLITSAVYKLVKSHLKRLLDWGLFLAAFAAVALFSLSPAYVVMGAALLGLLGRAKGGEG